MARRGTRGLALGLLLMALPLGGCEPKKVTIQLDGFADGAIQGVWLWRFSEVENRYERICRIDFADHRWTEEGEIVEYAQQCIDGQQVPGPVLTALVERLAQQPDSAVLDLWYVRYEDAGVYKATAFNVDGESPLSPGSLPL